MSSQMRPQTPQLMELHVYYVPKEVWNFKLNTIPVALSRKFISAGFIRVSPHMTLSMLRQKLGEYLGGVSVADKFQFLKCIGKNLAVVKANQEAELELKSFAPPYALSPELYLLPGVEYFEGIYPLSSSTQQSHRFNAEANRFRHGSRLSRLPQQKPEKSKLFLGKISRLLENQEVDSPVKWAEKEPVPVLHMKHKQDHYSRIQETQIEFRGKVITDKSVSSDSFFTPSCSSPADLASEKSDMLLQTSKQNHLSQDQKENSTQLRNVENNDHPEDTKLRRESAQEAGILKMMEEQSMEYAHKNQSLQQYRTSKSIAYPGEKLRDQADENKQNHFISLKEYISPPSPPPLALSVNPAKVSALQTPKNKMIEQVQQAKKDRIHMEKTREELIKKAKVLLEQHKLRRYHVCEEWKKKYFETKKTTVSLEDALNKLQQDLKIYHQKLLLQLEARESQKRRNKVTNSKNYTIIRITTVQHEIEQMRRKLDDTKMKLVTEIKMRKQAASDLRALRAELTQKKIHLALILQSRKSGL